jgi:hypothetical protein
VEEYAGLACGVGFERSGVVFGQVVRDLGGVGLGQVTHSDLEEYLVGACRELTRVLLQDHLDLRALREVRVPGGVLGSDGVARTRAESGRCRELVTVFGVVDVSRIAYRAPGLANVFPADAVLNLPACSFSHGMSRLAVTCGATGSFTGAQAQIERVTGVRVGTRQIRGMITHAAMDADGFYVDRQVRATDPGEVLVLTFDGKGIVMRPEYLRPATAKAAAKNTGHLSSRLSPGEKNGRKRMAELACVYDIHPEPRTPKDILAHKTKPKGGVGKTTKKPLRPKASGKWLRASLVESIPEMVAAGFDEAERRDPDHKRTWVALVDGNRTQIDAIQAQAKARGITVTIIIDFIHVLEYLWSAAWSFFYKGDQAAQDWVRAQATKILNGNARAVATGIRRRATRFGYTGTERKNADTTANYLTNHTTHLNYHTALTQGWPIATGIIEGAARHLIKDRMDITGARWGLPTAEATLTLRAIHTTGHLPNYWQHHLKQEHTRNHPTPTQNTT